MHRGTHFVSHFSHLKDLNGLVLRMRKFVQTSGEFTLTVVGSDKDTIGETEQAVLLGL